MKVAIVGGGIMGLCAAWELTRRGAAVELFEQGPLPHDRSASVDRHRAIRYPYGRQRGYQAMVGEAFAAWDRLWAQLGERHYIETGTLVMWSRSGGAEPEWALDSLDSLKEAGLPVEALSPYELGNRFPVLDPAGIDGGFFEPHGGALLADHIVGALAALLPRRGAVLHPYTPVEAIDAETCTVTVDPRWTLQADAVVVATGAWTGKLLPELAPRVNPTHTVVVYMEPPLDHAVAWHGMPLILADDGGGHGFYLLPPVGGHGMKIGELGPGTAGDPDQLRPAPAAEALRIYGLADGRFREFRRYRKGEARACYYDNAAEERFIVEPLAAHGRAFVMTGFSGHGFKFGALMGEKLAAAIYGETDPASLAAWASGAG